MKRRNKRNEKNREQEKTNVLLRALLERLSVLERMWPEHPATEAGVLPEKKTFPSTSVVEKIRENQRESPAERKEEKGPLSVSPKKSPVPVVTQVREFLQARYDFRCNVLTGQTEYREREEGPFRPVDSRAKSTFYYEVQAAGIYCYESQLHCFLNSFRIGEYHPFREYLAELPPWDGKDRIGALAGRVSEDPLWHCMFRRWMLGMTAQWLGLNPRYAHSVAPLLVSREQGLHKSTFCKILLPPELSRYYTDSFSFTNVPQAERKLAEYGLISLDEFDRYSSRNQADLKNLMQTTSLHLRRSYQPHATALSRIASFIGTSNSRELLTDKTGSRRFYCVEVTRLIDTDTPLDYEQLYAQLNYLVSVANEPYWPSEAEKAAMEAHNEAFYKISVEENLFREVFREVERGTPGALLLSAEEIFRRLRHHNPPAMRGRKAGAFGKLLIDMGLSRIRLNTGNRYCVLPVTG